MYLFHMISYQMTPIGSFFHTVVDVANDVELMRRKEFDDSWEKRSHISGTYSGTSSGGKGFYRRCFLPHSSRSLHATIQLSVEGYSRRDSYS